MKKIILVLVMGTGLFILAACGATTEKVAESNEQLKSESNVQAPTGKELNIGILPAESAIPIILAKEKGFFEEVGVNVSIKTFTSPNDRNVAVQAKELDGMIGDVMSVATFYEHGVQMKITSDISEDFKILSAPQSGITEMAGLADKKVSLVPNFILEYIMDEFATEDQFTYEIVEIPSFAGRAEALMSNQIDGVVFTEPQASMLVQQGAHLLGSSKLAGLKGGTISFMDEIIQAQPGDIAGFYEGYNKAVDYMNTTDVSEYADILAAYQFPEAMSAYLSNMTDEYSHARTINQGQYENIIEWTKDKEQITKTYSYEELTDFQFIAH
ncbi:ABC transporter substrate-binding protein [Bacillus sp. PS06]|uniref:ABC transporter substrate-binding protein n=1 Tax=Bacillus sp. PS06 TaxID=2764176 RepID=UPI00177A8B1A|nr:ABC transporter substrate-binding protein [Bacillus sp. PS06]MBD8069093.1 ABC transporter substrate-binding protein [Bacillus sp. PS06]